MFGGGASRTPTSPYKRAHRRNITQCAIHEHISFKLLVGAVAQSHNWKACAPPARTQAQAQSWHRLRWRSQSGHRTFRFLSVREHHTTATRPPSTYAIAAARVSLKDGRWCSSSLLLSWQNLSVLGVPCAHTRIAFSTSFWPPQDRSIRRQKASTSLN